MQRLSQTGEMLTYLKKNGNITSFQAIKLFGATRLSAIIYDLRKDGHIIETKSKTAKNRRGTTTTFAVYEYKGERNV
jgi:hypothetical protein